MSPSYTSLPLTMTMPREQNSLAVFAECVTKSMVTLSSRMILSTFLRHFFRKAASPTLRASSTMRISGRMFTLMAKPSRARMPLE